MSAISLLSQGAAIGTGFGAAVVWLKASRVKMPAPAVHSDNVDQSVMAVIGAGERAAKLNRAAAIWTAVSVSLQAAAQLLTLSGH